MTVKIRRFANGDEEAVSALVIRCLREVNSRDYPPEVITRLCRLYSPATIRALAGERVVHVAEVDGEVAGTVSRDGHRVYTMFVEPRWSGRGVGRQLMDRVEEDAAAAGFPAAETAASITAHGFYRNRGYADVRQSRTEFGLTFVMCKPLGQGKARAGR